MKAIFLNTHSFLNSGDAGIVIAQIQLLKRYFPGIKISITSRTAGVDKRFYKSKEIKVFSPIIPAPSVYTGRIQKIEQSLKNFFALKEKKNLIKEIEQSDIVISSGGGYFYSNRKTLPGPMFLQNYLHIKIAQILRKSVVFFPQSFGPFYNSLSIMMLRDILNYDKTVQIFAREKISFDFLQTLLEKERNRDKVDICPDMTFYLRREDEFRNPTFRENLPRPIVVLTLRKWDFPDAKSAKEKKKKEDEYLAAIEEVCYSIFKERRGTIVIVPQVRGPGFFENDRIISLKLLAELKKIIPEKNLLFFDLPDFISPCYLIDIFSQADLVLATRFHSAVFAMISGVPIISITYQPKSTGIMNLLDLAHFCVDINEMDSARIIQIANEILSCPRDIKGKIENEVKILKNTIELKMDDVLKAIR